MAADPAAPVQRWQNEPVSFRHRAARFWVDALFRFSFNAPWFMSLTRPIWCNGAWYGASKLRGNLLANAARLLGPDSAPADRRKLARAVIWNFYDFVLEIGRNCRRSPQELASRVNSVLGEEYFAAVRSRKCGVIVATAHLGQYELGIAALRQKEPQVHVVYQKDRLELFDEIRTRLHRSLGVRDAPVEAGIDNWLNLREALLADHAVLMQADRVMPGQRGSSVNFGSGHIELPWGPVKLAAIAGSPILPCYCIRLSDGSFQMVIDSPIEPELCRSEPDRALERLADSIRRQVTAHPEQWLCFHRAWSEDQT